MASQQPRAGFHVQRALRTLTALLAGLLILSACGLSELFASGGAATPGGSRTASVPTSVPAGQPTPLEDWHTYTFPAYGFRVDVPAVLQPHHAILINGGSGEAIDWYYEQGPLGSPLRQAAADTSVLIQYSTAITDTNICPLYGTIITIGGGVAARQETNIPLAGSGPPPAVPYVRVSLVVGGVAIRIELHGTAPADTFFARYGAIWQHLLATFATFPPQPPLGATHPCG
jgi:hypothetical protein